MTNKLYEWVAKKIEINQMVNDAAEKKFRDYPGIGFDELSYKAYKEAAEMILKEVNDFMELEHTPEAIKGEEDAVNSFERSKNALAVTLLIQEKKKLEAELAYLKSGQPKANGVSGGVWVKASERLPKAKGYYITRLPANQPAQWLIKEVTYNPKYNDTYLNEWIRTIEWLDESLQPNGVWPSEEEIEDRAYSIANDVASEPYEQAAADEAACKMAEWLKSLQPLQQAGNGWSDVKAIQKIINDIEEGNIHLPVKLVPLYSLANAWLSTYKKNNPIK